MRIVDMSALAVCAVALVALTPRVALAYVDPSVMTYTIQALAGVAVALSAVIGVAYRRVRRRMVGALGIDENADKVVEPDVARVAAGEIDGENERMARFWQTAKSPGEARVLGYGARFALALAVAFALLFTLLVAGPFELIVANGGSLLFDLSSAWPPLVLGCIAGTIVVAALIALIPGRGFDVVAVVLGDISVLFWVQSMFLNGALPLADGSAVDWGGYVGPMALGVVVWIAILAAAVVFAVRLTKKARITAVMASVALVVVQSAGLVSLGISYVNDNESFGGASRYCITQEGMLDVGPGQNVIVFVLDMYDTSYLYSAMSAAPDITESLRGFTWYRNAAGSAIPTRFGVPYLLTGVMPQVGQTYSEFVTTRYEASTLLDDIADQGFDVGLYTDSLGPDSTWSDKVGIPLNVRAREGESVDWLGTLCIMVQTSLYRDMPWVAKPAFWYHTDLVNQIAMGRDDALSFGERAYVMNDASFYESLRTERLAVVDRGTQGSFRFIHLLGAHWPYVMDRDGNAVAEVEDGKDQRIGSMRIVCEYINQLKALGLFDDATIVITADHGYWQDTVETCTCTSSPLFLVKPAASGDDGDGDELAPLVIDNETQTGHVDYPATIIAAVGGDYERYGTPVSMVDPKAERVRQYFYLRHDTYNNIDYELQEYLIKGNALSFSDWERTGNVIPNDDKRLHP